MLKKNKIWYIICILEVSTMRFFSSKQNNIRVYTDESETIEFAREEEIDGKRILKLLIGVGLNGAGKTKMLNGIEYLKEKATVKPQLPTILPDYKPFLLDNESKEMPSELELSYYIDDVNYIYNIKISRDRIEEEELKIKGRGLKIYSRK